MESIRSYRVFDSQNLRFRKKNETKRIIGSKNKVVFDQSGTFFILTGTAVHCSGRGLYQVPGRKLSTV